MDGAKSVTDTVEQRMVGRCLAWAEALSKESVDRVGIKILAIVRTEYCENQYHRKGKGFLTMKISQEVVGANQALNRAMGKRKRLIFSYSSCMCGDASLVSDVSGYAGGTCLYRESP